MMTSGPPPPPLQSIGIYLRPRTEGMPRSFYSLEAVDSASYHVKEVVGTPKAAAAVVAVSLCVVDIVQGCSGLQGYVIHYYY